MGIPSLFKKLAQSHPELLVDSISHAVDTLYIDLNCLIHNASREVKIEDYQLCELVEVCEHITHESVIVKTISVLQTMISEMKPTHVFVAIDGPVPKSKMMKQRERRFQKSRASEETNHVVFDPSSITPGTVFMEKLSNRMDACIHFKTLGSDLQAGQRTV